MLQCTSYEVRCTHNTCSVALAIDQGWRLKNFIYPARTRRASLSVKYVWKLFFTCERLRSYVLMCVCVN